MDTVPVALSTFNKLFLWMARRPANFIFAGLWKFPNLDWSPPVLNSIDWASFRKTYTRPHSCHIRTQRASQLFGFNTAHQCTISHFIPSFSASTTCSYMCRIWFLSLSTFHLFSLSGSCNFLPSHSGKTCIKFPRMPSTTHTMHLYTVCVCVCGSHLCRTKDVNKSTCQLESPELELKLN